MKSDVVEPATRTDGETLLQVNDALEKLTQSSPRKAELVKLLFFAGLTLHCLLPQDRFANFKRPEPYIPKSLGQHAALAECHQDGWSDVHFDSSGALTEAVLLGTVAYRSGETLEWDAANVEVLNSQKVQQLVHKEYRKG